MNDWSCPILTKSKNGSPSLMSSIGRDMMANKALLPKRDYESAFRPKFALEKNGVFFPY